MINLEILNIVWAQFVFQGVIAFAVIVSIKNQWLSIGSLGHLPETHIEPTFISPSVNLVNETRFLYSRRDQNITAVGVGPQVNLLAPEGLVVFGANPLLPQPRVINQYQIVNNVSLSRGRHQIKFGVDYQFGGTDSENTEIGFASDGIAFFLPIDFATASAIPGLPTFSGLQAFDPSLRTPAQQEFLKLFTAIAPMQFQGFPSGVPFAEIALPTAFIQGFGRLALDSKRK
ncbi:MAG: hypothetical protein AB1489_30845, partial [Acidobacteriota bacterium]